MTTEAHRDAFEKIMISSLDRAIDFIKFAEAKNAALLTFASGWTVAIASVLIADANAARTTTPPAAPVTPGLTTSFTLSIALFAVAILVALWSFLPVRRAYASHHDPGQLNNLLYFGHVARFDAATFRSKALARYGPAAPDHYLEDLSDQVAVNSGIANRKFKAFNVGAWVTFVAIAVALWPLLGVIARSFLTLIGGR